MIALASSAVAGSLELPTELTLDSLWACIQRSMELTTPLKGFHLPKRKSSSTGNDPLLDQLDKVERQLQKWIAKSRTNAAWFRRDPLAAMRAAGLDMEDDIMLELEQITRAIAKKLK